MGLPSQGAQEPNMPTSYQEGAAHGFTMQFGVGCYGLRRPVATKERRKTWRCYMFRQK